jgi:hydrogenase maturation protease
MMACTLVIGFGNADRGDDGAALGVVNRLRARMGRRPLAEGDTGLEELGTETAVFVRQLLPELSVEAAGYDRLVFVDAHVAGAGRRLHCERVRPEPRRSAFSHVLHPSAFLWLVQVLSSRTPEAFLVSLQAGDFSTGRRLTPHTAGLVGPAAGKVWRLMRRPHSGEM